MAISVACAAGIIRHQATNGGVRRCNIGDGGGVSVLAKMSAGGFLMALKPTAGAAAWLSAAEERNSVISIDNISITGRQALLKRRRGVAVSLSRRRALKRGVLYLYRHRTISVKISENKMTVYQRGRTCYLAAKATVRRRRAGKREYGVSLAIERHRSNIIIKRRGAGGGGVVMKDNMKNIMSTK
jgi:hypothetical protein